jgi:hypothetical protein
LNKVKKQLLSGQVFFNSLMVGSQNNAIKVYSETEKKLHDGGYRYIGFITPEIMVEWNTKADSQTRHIAELENIIDEHQISQVVLAMEKSEHSLLENIINR